MRLPNSAHEAHPWVISQIAPDFQLLDAWALPTPGGPDDFPLLLEIAGSLDPARTRSPVTRALFAVRLVLGRWFGWDDQVEPLAIPGRQETTLSARLPEHLRGSAEGGTLTGEHGFVPLYRTGDEWAAEIGNATVHGVLQLAWVEDGQGGYRGQLGVYVKPRGAKGRIYLMLIAPFRHLIVYPALMREIGRAWNAQARRRQ